MYWKWIAHRRHCIHCSWAGFAPFTQPTVSSSNPTNNQPLCILLQFPYRGSPTYNYNCDGPPIRQISESENRNKQWPWMRKCKLHWKRISGSAIPQFIGSKFASCHKLLKTARTWDTRLHPNIYIFVQVCFINKLQHTLLSVHCQCRVHSKIDTWKICSLTRTFYRLSAGLQTSLH